MWARIDGTRVVEITDVNPVGRFHPALVWVECDEFVEPDDCYEEGQFRKPVKEPHFSYPRLTALEMLDLFSEEEQLAVVTASLTIPRIKLWYDRLIAATFVTYEDPRTEKGLQSLVDAKLITAERKVEIQAAMRPAGRD